MKAVTIILFVFLVTSCASTRDYNSAVPIESEITEAITYSFDDSKKEGDFRTEAYLSDGFTASRRITYFYRAKRVDGRIGIQIHARMGGDKRCLIEQVYDEFDEKVDVTLFGKKSVSRTFVTEDFGLHISMKDLEKMSQHDSNFKALGVFCTIPFTIDKRVSNAFIKALYKHS